MPVPKTVIDQTKHAVSGRLAPGLASLIRDHSCSVVRRFDDDSVRSVIKGWPVLAARISKEIVDHHKIILNSRPATSDCFQELESCP